MRQFPMRYAFTIPLSQAYFGNLPKIDKINFIDFLGEFLEASNLEVTL